jgi:hypothetical protein
MIDYSQILVAALNLDIDYELMAKELTEAMKSPDCVPFCYKDPLNDNQECNSYSLFLRENNTMPQYSYRGAKLAELNDWDWSKSLDIPYTISAIEKLPFKKLGTVRAVYFPDVPCIEHTDWDDSSNLKNTLGLSLIPTLGQTHCNVWSEKLSKYVSIPGHAMLLNDSNRHNVPKTTGLRITVRLFGEIDYTKFDDAIVREHYYTL